MSGKSKAKSFFIPFILVIAIGFLVVGGYLYYNHLQIQAREAEAAETAAQEEKQEATPSDTTAPVIEGAEDLTAYVGDSISYKANVTVTDDTDPNPQLTVDNSQVNVTEAGSYTVTYTATDASGNSVSQDITLTLEEKPEGYVDPELIYEEAQPIYDSIITDDMTDMEKAFAIYKWVRGNIGYSGSSDKSHWTAGAYEAFTKRTGDCFTYFAAAKALYNMAGIDNVDVEKKQPASSRHYWSLINIGNGWYHVDCTPFKGGDDDFFMLTDEELAAYDASHWNAHPFESDLYPDRATESVQYMVDYSAGVLNDQQ